MVLSRAPGGTPQTPPHSLFTPSTPTGGWALNMKDLKLLQIIGKGEFGGEPRVPSAAVALRGGGGLHCSPPQGDGGTPGGRDASLPLPCLSLLACRRDAGGLPGEQSRREVH